MAHVFWIPVIPLGHRSQWQCTQCGEVPTGKQEVSTGLKTFVVVLLSIAFLGLLTVGSDQGFEPSQLWGVRIGVLLLAIGVSVSIWYDKRQAELSADRRTTAPFDEENCRYCGTFLVGGPERSCPNCGVKRL